MSDLFDWAEAERQKEAAMDRVEIAADDAFKEAALRIIHFCARNSDEFTTDKVWWYLHERGIEAPEDLEPRVMGALMRSAASEGWIEATDRTVKSVKTSNHRRPVRVWRSLIRR